MRAYRTNLQESSALMFSDILKKATCFCRSKRFTILQTTGFTPIPASLAHTALLIWKFGLTVLKSNRRKKNPQARTMSLNNSEDMLSSVPKGSDLDIVFVIYTSNGFLSNTKPDLLNTSEKISKGKRFGYCVRYLYQ